VAAQPVCGHRDAPEIAQFVMSLRDSAPKVVTSWGRRAPPWGRCNALQDVAWEHKDFPRAWHRRAVSLMRACLPVPWALSHVSCQVAPAIMNVSVKP
jgi:hypothetical protein